MSDSIDTVVFDLGGVLIRVEQDPALGWLVERGFRPGTREEFVAASGLPEHECGALSGEAFLDRLAALVSAPTTREELHRWWTGFFAPDESMLTLARTLRGHYRVFILSNTGPLHWEQAVEQFDLARVADAALTSFEVRASKPDPAIYAAAERRFALVPRHTVFIDDLAANVQAARDAGWHAIRHRSHAATVTALKDLGIDLIRSPLRGQG